MKDATPVFNVAVPSLGFNPRVREGRDTKAHWHLMIVYGFNPRVREGRDLIPAPICKRRPCFNPRVREGRDWVAKRQLKAMKFQSTRP